MEVYMMMHIHGCIFAKICMRRGQLFAWHLNVFVACFLIRASSFQSNEEELFDWLTELATLFIVIIYRIARSCDEPKMEITGLMTMQSHTQTHNRSAF